MSLKLVPTYYPSPNFSIPPPDANGPLRLGTIIADLKDPVPLNPADRLPVPDEEVIMAHLTGYSTTLSNSDNLEVGILARIFGLKGFGGELSGRCGRDQKETLLIDRLETVYFNPSIEYMTKSMQTPAVKTFRRTCRDRLPLYLISGLKVARGASASVASFTSVGRVAEVSIPEPLTSLVKLGPKMQANWASESGMAFEGSSDFIMAYKVTKMRWTKGDLRSKPHTSGATMANDADHACAQTESVDYVHNYVDEAWGNNYE